jgi:hypothetical protein
MQKINLMLAALASATLAFTATAPAIAGQDMHDKFAEASIETLYSGQWTKKSFKSSGTWEIYAEGGKTFVKLSSDFRTRNAPDLKIFLSPQAARDTNGRNATNGAVLISPLSSNSGEQVYEIPEGVDLAAYKSILIHCEQFSKLWSAADLSLTTNS